MLVVLDTNVLLSALRAQTGPPARILDAWRAGRFRLATSREQIEEFTRAARYPKLRPYLPRAAIGRVVSQLRTAEVLLRRLRRAGDSPDPGDDYLLSMALAAARIFSLPATRRCLAMRRVGATRIVSARDIAAVFARMK